MGPQEFFRLLDSATLAAETETVSLLRVRPVRPQLELARYDNEGSLDLDLTRIDDSSAGSVSDLYRGHAASTTRGPRQSR